MRIQHMAAALIAAIIVVLFLGISSYAAYPGACTATITNCTSWIQLYCDTRCANAKYPQPNFPPVINSTTKEFEWTWTGTVALGYHPAPASLCTVWEYYWEDGMWKQQDIQSVGQWTFTASAPNHGLPSVLPAGCPTCDQEYQQKIIDCGGEQYIKNWDDTLCTGDCDICLEAKDSLATKCGGAEMIFNWSDITCTGECFDPDSNLGQCQN